MRIIVFLLLFFTFYPLGFGQQNKIVVVIDPGHGGKDHGHLAISDYHKPEKELNLLIAQKLGGYILEYLTNVEVHYTRKTDSYSSLNARVEYVNNLKADYVISVHCNGSSNPSAKGTETHVHSRTAGLSLKLAKEIEKDFKTRAARYSRGIKDGDDRGHSIQLLKYTEMPTVLVECGFLTNRVEANYLNSERGQDYIASALFRAFRSFIKKQHPEIEFQQNKNKTAKGSYRVQIMSSKSLINKSTLFDNLGEPVEAVKVDSKSRYKYKYYAGRFDTEEKANQFLRIAKKKGFPDAFVVRL